MNAFGRWDRYQQGKNYSVSSSLNEISYPNSGRWRVKLWVQNLLVVCVITDIKVGQLENDGRDCGGSVGLLMWVSKGNIIRFCGLAHLGLNVMAALTWGMGFVVSKGLALAWVCFVCPSRYWELGGLWVVLWNFWGHCWWQLCYGQ